MLRRSTKFASRLVSSRRTLSTNSTSQSLSWIKNENLIQTGAFINGEFIENHNDRFEVSNPYSLETLTTVTNSSISQLQDAINVAEDTFQTFKSTSPRSRSEILLRFYELIKANKLDLATMITLENGKPLKDALGEISYAASFIQWFAEEAPRIYGDTIPSANPQNHIITLKQPIGPVGILTPWNFPSAMITRKLGAAIAAGCTSVIKPASETPLSALALCHLADYAGVPPGVVNVLPCRSEQTAEVGKYICESPQLKKVSFTGSTKVGKLLMKQSSDTLKKLSFELGGNAPFIVFPDCDLDRAVEGLITAKFRSSGQTCICVNRVFVHDSIYDEFSEKLVKSLQSITKLGSGLEKATTHGPLIHVRAVEKVEELINDALNKGAECALGGNRESELGPNFYNLTVLKDVNDKMDIFHNEIFGPVASLIKFKDTENVIKMANETRVGLAGYFFTNDIKKLFKVAEDLNVGMIGVNTGSISESTLPFGGVSESGFGREGSKYGIDEYLVTKSLVIGE